MRHIPELLAPVGGPAQLYAAVNNGADAVYLGGSRFNARAKAENFSLRELREVISYAHQRNVKVYITFNILIKDRELGDALDYAEALYSIGADAVILQDMGLARLIRKYVPGLPLHLSTQGTVYNVWAVDLMKEFGFSRIVPARELSLEEIRRFTAACHGNVPVMAGKASSGGAKEASMPACEVEVFVHGALCMCYSGQCQMSRVLGAGENGPGSVRSGNRGLCAQPCRLPYTNDRGETGYFLSPKDLCLLNELPGLCQAGVDSLKIEGRLKSAEYVAVTTSIYRKYLDQYARTGQVQVSREDARDLRQIFNRGGFSSGYLHGNPGEKILSGQSPKNTGVYIGKVKSVADKASGVDAKAVRGAAAKGAVLVDVKISEHLSEGDGVEIRPGRSNQISAGAGKAAAKASGGIVTFRRKLSGDILRIGDMKGKIAPGDLVFKVTDSELAARATASYAGNTVEERDRRMQRKVPVRMEFHARTGETAVLKVTDGTAFAKVSSASAAEAARKAPLTEERVRAQLIKLGNTPFEAMEEDLRVELDGLCMIPMAEINRMRRECIASLMKEKAAVKREPVDLRMLEEAVNGLKPLHLPQQLPGELVPLEIFLEGAQGTPCIFPVSRGRLDQMIEEHFDEIAELVRETGIVCGNAGWIRQFLQAGVKVYGVFGLNVYNGQAQEAFEEIGVHIMEGSLELIRPGEGNIPLMITAHPVESEYLTDRKGVRHQIKRSPSGDQTIIY